MFERFTDRARKVMALANQESQRFNHKYIGTEHILLGLLKEGAGNGIKVLKNLGVDLHKARLEVEKLLKKEPEIIQTGKLPQSPRAKKVLEYAIEEAENLKHKFIGTEHLALGLLREGDGVAAQVLLNLGLKLEDVREQALNLYEGEIQLDAAGGAARTSEELDAPPLVLLLDPGTATAEEIGQLLLEFSTLYRMLGGSGITFTKSDAREVAFA